MRKTVFFLLGASLAGCTLFSGELCDYGVCRPDALLDGSPDGVAPDGTIPDATTDRDPPPPGCDTPNEPLKNPEKCLVDSFGVFVSSGGSDSNDGSKAKPFKTIGKALGGGKGRIVVCEGTYTESIEIKADAEIYSGVSCDFTKAGGKAKIVATKPEYGVSIGKVTTLLSDIEIAGADGTATSPNSVGVWVVEATSVKLRNVAVTAKSGFNGEGGAPGATGTYAVGNGNGKGAAPLRREKSTCFREDRGIFG